MVENEQYKIQSLLKTMFPGLESKIEHIYKVDPVFREIAEEYHECLNKQATIVDRTGKRSDIYADTINELKDELLTYLNERMK